MPLCHLPRRHLRVVLMREHDEEVVVKRRADLALLKLYDLQDFFPRSRRRKERPNQLNILILHHRLKPRQPLNLAHRSGNKHWRISAVL